ncbi:histidine kinase [Desulfosarcina sp.]|nr:histidine kinase [Desulfosarcina sp.]
MIRNLRSISCLFFVLFSFYAYGQIRTDVPKSELDSLIQMIPNYHDKELVDHLNLIATSISQRYPDSCLHYAKIALEKAEGLEYDLGIAGSKFNYGNGFYFKNDLKNAMINYYASLSLLENKAPSVLHGDLLTQIGLVHYNNYSFETSVEYLLRAADIFNSVNDINSKFYAIRMVFHTFLVSQLTEESFQYVKERKDYYKNRNKRRYVQACNEMGLIYLTLKDSLAVEYFMEGLTEAKKINDLVNIGVLATNVCCFFKDKPVLLQNFTRAEKFSIVGIEAISQTNRYALKAEIYKDYGQLCHKYNKFKKADSIFKKALGALQEFDSTLIITTFDDPSVKMRDQVVSRQVKVEIYKSYIELYNSLKDYKKAFDYEVLKNKLNEWIQANKIKRESDLIEAKYEAEKVAQQFAILSKENELQKLQASRSINMLVVLVLVSVITGLLLLVYNRNIGWKAEKEKTLLQQKLFRSQMNPHFIFNSLASIQNSIINEEPLKASKYLARFSKLVRTILDGSVKEFCTLEEEILTIENYLELQKIRFPEKFDFEIDVDLDINLYNISIPTMLAQPFIENAIEHGIKHKSKKGNISVKFSLYEGAIQLEIEDDGVGRKKAREILKQQEPEHNSLAINITSQRLEILNKKRKQKITLDIEDLIDENGNPSGTRVRFNIPYKS